MSSASTLTWCNKLNVKRLMLKVSICFLVLLHLKIWKLVTLGMVTRAKLTLTAQDDCVLLCCSQQIVSKEACFNLLWNVEHLYSLELNQNFCAFSIIKSNKRMMVQWIETIKQLLFLDWRVVWALQFSHLKLRLPKKVHKQMCVLCWYFQLEN